MMDRLHIVYGWEPREAIGDALFQFSAVRRTSVPLVFHPLMEHALRFRNLYTRPHEERDGQLWCPISDAPMATSFANSRFLTPWLTDADWALFCDGADMLWLADPAEMFALADPTCAVQVVKRRHEPGEQTKMDNQVQTAYPRKNWSSVILWNRKHPANERLTLEMVNGLPGRELHRFCWLEDDEIGELPLAWNHLVGVDDDNAPAKLAHFTLGLPSMGYDKGRFADLWLQELAILDATRGTLRAA